MVVRVLAVLGVSSSNTSIWSQHAFPSWTSAMIYAEPVVTPESSLLLAITKIFNDPSGGEWRMVVERVRAGLARQASHHLISHRNILSSLIASPITGRVFSYQHHHSHPFITHVIRETRRDSKQPRLSVCDEDRVKKERTEQERRSPRTHHHIARTRQGITAPVSSPRDPAKASAAVLH